jgi:polysaccharide export outer membrane protein
MCPVANWAQETATPETKIQPVGLAPGDQIGVRLFDLPDLGPAPLQVIVNADGAIRLPYVGEVPVEGMTPMDAEAAVAEALRTKGIVKEPNVSVQVISAANMTVEVTGQVTSPQAIPIYAPTPVSFLMAKVSGQNGLSAGHLTIVHHSGGAPTSVDLGIDGTNAAGLNTLVYPGDIVHVSSAGVFFMVGEINRPGVYPMRGALNIGQVTSQFGMGVVDHMTLLQALTEAGGITAIAARSKCRLLRAVNGRREEIMIDIVKLEKGEIADPLLHPDDIIYVPSSYIRAQTNNLFQTVLSSLYVLPSIRSF